MDDAALRRIQDALNDNGYQKYCAWADGNSDVVEGPGRTAAAASLRLSREER